MHLKQGDHCDAEIGNRENSRRMTVRRRIAQDGDDIFVAQWLGFTMGRIEAKLEIERSTQQLPSQQTIVLKHP